jgi:hypothetical protein
MSTRTLLACAQHSIATMHVSNDAVLVRCCLFFMGMEQGRSSQVDGVARKGNFR